MPLAARGRDDLVMATNNSSIVSKRSVERIYYPGEPEYYRYFVKKFQRRAPLINRGYQLRLHLIDAVVRRFLRRPSPKRKVVVNLGCGSDVLPWQCLSRYPDECRDVRFVDIDFPNVIAAKSKIVRQTPELQAVLTNLAFPTEPPQLLTRSDQYYQIACDLRQLPVIGTVLSGIVDAAVSEFLFVAEVSITYMEPESADALIKWASALGDAEFCLLEQILPGGPSDPFAQTMLQHFDKLNTPLKCIHTYPTTAAQERRFEALGWPQARSWSLWDAWKDPFFLSAADRQHLDTLEVFDEWEEFSHFCSHYLLLWAGNSASALPYDFDRHETADTAASLVCPSTPVRLDFSPAGQKNKTTCHRRFGVSLRMADVLGSESLASCFGLGSDGRLPSCDLYSAGGEDENEAPSIALADIEMHPHGPAARMCAAATDMGDAGYLLSGGRASPTSVFDDTWILKRDDTASSPTSLTSLTSYRWHKSRHSLPLPLFRHSVVRLHNSQLALLAGGKSSATSVFSGFLLFHPRHGWTECVVDASGLSSSSTPRPPPVFGAVLVCAGRRESGPRRSVQFHGVLAGGMTADGLVYSGPAVRWVLDVSNISQQERPILRLQALPSTSLATSLLSRFGAACTQVGDWTVVVGGVDNSGSVLGGSRDIVQYRVRQDGREDAFCLDYQGAPTPPSQDWPRPVLVGMSLVSIGNGLVAIVGGGMTCFSMGSVWSRGIYTFPIRTREQESLTASKARWTFGKTMTITAAGDKESSKDQTSSDASHAPPSIVQIPRVKLESDEHFQAILQAGKPVILEGLDLGACLSCWDSASLLAKVGADRKVVVHESSTQAMDFVSKNFRYTTQTFDAFLEQVAAGKKLYLRALSADRPSEAPTRLDVDFPGLAADFVLPPELSFVQDRLFSSVLRISGPVNMWLHYDVLANVYCQIQGTKRFVLFPPTDVTRLGFRPGASSSSLDVFSSPSLDVPFLSRCHPYEAAVGAGDVLFLPPLWLHTASPLSASSTAVNVFFRDLQSGSYATGRDVYANRDLAAYEKARQDVAKMDHLFGGLPREAREFYLGRILAELAERVAA